MTYDVTILRFGISMIQVMFYLYVRSYKELIACSPVDQIRKLNEKCEKMSHSKIDTSRLQANKIAKVPMFDATLTDWKILYDRQTKI